MIGLIRAGDARFLRLVEILGGVNPGWLNQTPKMMVAVDKSRE